MNLSNPILCHGRNYLSILGLKKPYDTKKGTSCYPWIGIAVVDHMTSFEMAEGISRNMVSFRVLAWTALWYGLHHQGLISMEWSGINSPMGYVKILCQHSVRSRFPVRLQSVHTGLDLYRKHTAVFSAVYNVLATLPSSGINGLLITVYVR